MPGSILTLDLELSEIYYKTTIFRMFLKIINELENTCREGKTAMWYRFEEPNRNNLYEKYNHQEFKLSEHAWQQTIHDRKELKELQEIIHTIAQRQKNMESTKEKVRGGDLVKMCNTCWFGVLQINKEWGKVIWRDKGWEFSETSERQQCTDWRSPVNFK